MSLKFYDTNGILNLLDKIFDDNFVISSKSLEEIEHIKVSDRKDQDIKYRARKLAHLLDDNKDKYDVIVPSNNTFEILKEFQLEISPDNIIMACAYEYNKNCKPVIFISDDICCKIVARNVFGLQVESIKENNNLKYQGFIEKVMSEEEMAYFYSHLKENTYDLLVNEYLIIKNDKGEEVECYKWDGETYISLYKKPIKSIAFGDKMKPKDIYQTMVIDSMIKNTITAVSGKAGSGKSLLSLMVAMHLIESGKYDRLVVLYNPTPVRGAQQQGFYTGSAFDKAMQSNIGQILTTKFGDRYMVDTLIQQEKLKLVAMCDCRGMEISEHEILWITESENTSIDLMKISLSRVASGAKVFIEGDFEQIDNYLFMNQNNGFLRAIDVLKGEDIFGYVQLQHVWRSKIAELINKM